MRRAVAGAVVAALMLMSAPTADARGLCYWSERFEKGCRNQAVYLTKKKPPVHVEVQLGKGKPCDARGCINPPRELGWVR
jgi:hypothetical protein